MIAPGRREKLKVLITVKTYPIPSKKYDELVCTAGVTETGEFIRLYPINFEVIAEKHQGRDVRKESYRPDSDSIKILGEPIRSNPGNWSARAKYALAKKSRSMEDLYEQQKTDRTSLGIFKPKKVNDLVISPDDPEWPPKFLSALQQQRLFEYRQKTLVPPRKVPFKFHYSPENPRAAPQGALQIPLLLRVRRPALQGQSSNDDRRLGSRRALLENGGQGMFTRRGVSKSP